jgi:hypothetical protein
MDKIAKTTKQLSDLIRSEASARIGPWPRNMQVFVYPLNDCWRIVIGYSDLADTDYRDKVMALTAELRGRYSLVE